MDSPGVEPGSSDCQPDVFPLDHEPVPVQWTCRGVEPRFSWLQARRLPIGRAAHVQFISFALGLIVRRPRLKVRPGIEPGLPPYRGGVLPQHLQTNFTSDPGWNRTIDFLDVDQASLPLDHGIVLVTGVRVELTNSTRLSTSSLYQFAYPAGCRFGCRTRQTGLMRPG